MYGYGDKIFSVTEITGLIKDTLEEGFSNIRITGEISNCRPSSTGHLYFTLKDKNAMISAVMFKGRQRALAFTPGDGMLVKVSGNISVYALRGSYQIICDSIEKAGEGEILAMLEERKKKLAAEGLFDSERKKQLPMFPSKVAVVTSPTGAAIRDILRVTGRRNSGLNIAVVPAPVQGDTAAAKIAEQIRRADVYSLGEVLIVGRGGGSLEDLLPFSDEEVVRAIAECSIPVISAVGHEIDRSLSDLAADVSAPTPSAAAEIVSAGRDELAARVSQLYESITGEMSRQTERIRLLASKYSGANLEESFFILIQPVLNRFDDMKEELITNFSNAVKDRRHRLDGAARELNAVSPQSILERGYTIMTDKQTGRLIKSAAEAEPGSEALVRFHDGTADVSIKERLQNEEI
ncbi:MAG: exodeoxyribonuclease VII large subunit [Spirochaetales bacterium]|uniref:Exodeoxyribonuclease 7 large subunit n=1 Tax=Candidatus Thalassospirochaeta sargassi TaxID=3119039 RepID=A0AAJ1MKW1_9SPIO|nr:exodeoxyribonuclease VII large subunit [Spirochaetales bacterium]